MSKAKEEARAALAQKAAAMEMTLESDWVSRDPANPFEITVQLQGGWGTVRLMDPPVGASLRASKIEDSRQRLAVNLKACFVEAIEDQAVRWPAKDAAATKWVDLIDSMPGMVYGRIQDAMDAVGYTPEGESEAGN